MRSNKGEHDGWAFPALSVQRSGLFVRSFVSVELPKPAHRNGIRLRWWQPHNPGQSCADWLLDDIVIGGKQVNPNEVNDDSSTAGRRNIEWLHQANVRYGQFCGRPYVAVSNPSPGETVVMTTVDIAVADSIVLEFSLAIGCNASWDVSEVVVQPVQLHYSTDLGVTWHLVVDECVSFDPMCNGRITTASIYYANGGWQRITIPLSGHVTSR